MRNRDMVPPLVYVYIGDSLPGYVGPSLRLTRRLFRGNMIVLTNATNIPSVPGVTFEDFSLWYREEPFSAFRDTTHLDAQFRGGFWLLTAERFFVLNQYMDKEQLGALFHAELDNVVFNLDGVASSLDKMGAGIFYPTDQAGRGCGSLVYCNDSSAMSAVTAFMANNTPLGDEMNMLGAFVREHPDKGFPLPSATALERKAGGAGFPMGIFDAMSIGQWLFGLDPANTVYSTYTKERNSHSRDPVEEVRFSLETRKGQLIGVIPHSPPFRVHNLHVHSKIFSRLTVFAVIRFYLFAHRFTWRVPVVIQPGHWRHKLLKGITRHSEHPAVQQVARSPLGHHFLRFLVASSRVPLSNKQLEGLHILLSSYVRTTDIRRPDAAIFFAGPPLASGSAFEFSLQRSEEQSSQNVFRFEEQKTEPLSFDSANEALGYLLSIEGSNVLVLPEKAPGSEAPNHLVPARNLLYPDSVKPRWEPPYELPTFPDRSRAVTFTTQPHLVSLEHLRDLFSEESHRLRWAKQVRPDTFGSALVNAYAHHMLIRHRGRVTLATTSG